jgi:hypothetical protein
MPTFKSGAFIQQCFASHPLSLSFKAATPPDRTVLHCTNCDMRHRLIARASAVSAPDQNPSEKEAIEQLTACLQGHPGGLRVSAVDVVADSVQFKCVECRRTYRIEVALFETYRKEV